MPNSLAARITQARKLHDWSRSELGRRVGVQPSAAAQWEQRPGTSPSIENLIKIALVTGTAFEWLATGRGPARTDASTEIDAVVMSDFAQDLFEERLLIVARKVSPKRRQIILKFLEDMAK